MTYLTILITSGMVNYKHQKGGYMHTSIIINSNTNTLEQGWHSVVLRLIR
ncbi:hypothetical protein [Bacillus mycoides]